ncbi:hypothetical protein HYFRA_00000751 [Hymenoscyphus fraxineus]|uniref:AAA+ ATPase domain-containing protein n=1 Tax=Hymenoscyphus fraxineus TaxID=746836 RepID=A0A9N9KQ46_9HELO|nr:hypothetical protein HYFRA_00000751 [Hymenoscyphus fraxineus]
MSSILRQSSGSLARISRSTYPFAVVRRTATQTSFFRAAQASRISVSQTRAYTSPPPRKSKDNGAAKKGNGEKTEPKGAAGTGHLDHGKPSPSKPAEDGKSTDETKGKSEEEAPLEPGMVRMGPEEEKLMAAQFAKLKAGLPQSSVEVVDQAFEIMKKKGIPKEIVDLLREHGNGKAFSLVAMGKLFKLSVKLVGSIVNQLNEEDLNRGNKEWQEKKKILSDFESNETKSKESGGGAGSPPPGGKKSNKSKQVPPGFKVAEFKLDMSTLLLSGFTSWLLYKMVMPGEQGRDITYQEFKSTFFDKGLVEKLTVVNRDRVRVGLHREAAQSMYPDSPAANPNFHYYFSIGSVEAFEKRLEDAQNELGIPSSERIPISYTRDTDSFSLLINFGPTLLFLGAIYYMSRRAGGGGGSSGVFGMGKSRAKQFNHETDIKVKFKDVAGMDEAKLEIMEFVSFLKTPEQFERLGAKIPRGAILSGPPGTGKTLLAKATAGESGVPFFSVSGSEFVEMFVGVGASRVRDLFSLARKNTPCIIFIDEIDAIGKARGKAGSFNGGNDEREATLNQILTEMDGFNTSEQVVVLAGTNRSDVLDQALTRPGRFDRQIAIERPTMEGRKQIFLVHLKKIVTFEDLDFLTGRLSALTPGFSGADIANCCNEAALIAARTESKSVAMIHFEKAIERVVGGLERKTLILNPEEKRTVAYHEAGHAICGWYLKHADPLLKVSIVPRGQGLGYAQYLPAGDSYLMTTNQLMDRMAMALGGRISEELHFDTVTSGASDDFNKVTRMATAMVTKWGMSKKVGTLHFRDSDDKFNKPFAESTAQAIDSEVRRIVDEAYTKCKDLLTEKKAEIGIVAEELLSKEVLGRDDMVRLLGQRPFEENKDFVKYFNNTGPKSAPPPPPTEVTGHGPEKPLPI